MQQKSWNSPTSQQNLLQDLNKNSQPSCSTYYVNLTADFNQIGLGLQNSDNIKTFFLEDWHWLKRGIEEYILQWLLHIVVINQPYYLSLALYNNLQFSLVLLVAFLCTIYTLHICTWISHTNAINRSKRKMGFLLDNIDYSVSIYKRKINMPFSW